MTTIAKGGLRHLDTRFRKLRYASGIPVIVVDDVSSIGRIMEYSSVWRALMIPSKRSSRSLPSYNADITIRKFFKIIVIKDYFVFM